MEYCVSVCSYTDIRMENIRKPKKNILIINGTNGANIIDNTYYYR